MLWRIYWAHLRCVLGRATEQIVALVDYSIHADRRELQPLVGYFQEWADKVLAQCREHAMERQAGKSRVALRKSELQRLLEEAGEDAAYDTGDKPRRAAAVERDWKALIEAGEPDKALLQRSEARSVGGLPLADPEYLPDRGDSKRGGGGAAEDEDEDMDQPMSDARERQLQRELRALKEEAEQHRRQELEAEAARQRQRFQQATRPVTRSAPPPNEQLLPAPTPMDWESDERDSNLIAAVQFVSSSS